jgi:hypothetical protein
VMERRALLVVHEMMALGGRKLVWLA